jgi:hypothetical protein
VNGCTSVFHNSHNHDRRILPVMNHDMCVLHWYLEPKTNIFTMGTFWIDYYNRSWKFRMDQVWWVYNHLIVIKSTFNLYASGSLILKSLRYLSLYYYAISHSWTVESSFYSEGPDFVRDLLIFIRLKVHWVSVSKLNITYNVFLHLEVSINFCFLLCS